MFADRYRAANAATKSNGVNAMKNNLTLTPGVQTGEASRNNNRERPKAALRYACPISYVQPSNEVKIKPNVPYCDWWSWNDRRCRQWIA